jgi:hypothetical protein
MNVVPLVRTAFSTQELLEAVEAVEPSMSREAAGLVWSQWALETGRGKACACYNIANLKVTIAQANAGVPFTMLPNTWERINGKKVIFQPPDPQTWFRAFSNLREGVEHHVAFLKRRLSKAWDALLAGNPTRFAAELKAKGYYTEDLDIYTRGIRSLHAEWMRTTIVPLFAPEPSEPMGGIIHGTHVVDWALEQREAEFEARIDELVGGFGRYDDVGED